VVTVARGGDGVRVVIGLGARSRVSEEDLDFALDRIVRTAGLTSADVAVLATLDRRAGEDAVRAVAARRGWAVRGFAAAELAAQEVPHPSATVARRVATPSVAEAAALLAAGAEAALLVPKRVYPCVTAAVARGVPAERSPA
jgi:cobalamin biosynthesis protein CbiG